MAGFDDTIAFDYQVAAHDTGRSVTFTSRQSTGDVTDAVGDAVREELSLRELALAGGYYSGTEVIYYLPDSEVSNPPKDGDAITDAGTTYAVTGEVRGVAGRSSWRCVCVKGR